MTDLYHQKECRVAFVSPSANLFEKSQDSLRARLGIRAHLTAFESIRECQQEVRDNGSFYEMVALDSASLSSLPVLPQFLGAGDLALPVLLLLRRRERDIAKHAMDAGYKALLSTEDDLEFRQFFPAMTLRIITQFRGERKRATTYSFPVEEQTASDLGVSDQVLAPKKFPHTRFIA